MAGKITFDEGKQYESIGRVNDKSPMDDGQHRLAQRQDQAGRDSADPAIAEEEVDQMGQQIDHNSTSAENEAVLEDIRFATSVMEEVVQNYVLYEVERTGRQYQTMREGLCAGRSFSF